jgi:multisubunit Na+/H+ antiporter MnhB subunit
MSSLKISLIVILLSILEVGLAIGVILMPEPTVNIDEFIHSNLSYTQLVQPTTAVLLNFRSYDTLLSAAILLLIFLGIWRMPASDEFLCLKPAHQSWRRVLGGALFLVIFIVLSYLLWKTPIYASSVFPMIGALLAISVVSLSMLRLNPFPMFQTLPDFLLRLLLTSSLLIFLLIGFLVLLQEAYWLEYPASLAGNLTMIVQISLSFTFGLTLILVSQK